MVSELIWKNGASPSCGSALGHAAAGAEQQAALVGDDDLRLRAAGEMALHLLGEVMDIDHRAFDAASGQPVEHMIDERLAGDFDQRFGPRGGERLHARADTGGQHHGMAGRGVHECKAGTLASYQARKLASAGCANERCR